MLLYGNGKTVTVLICNYYVFYLNGYICQDTQFSKNLVDAYFALSHRHVNWYIKWQQSDMTTATVLYLELAYEFGICHTITELINID